jgi:hypothetical protein
MKNLKINLPAILIGIAMLLVAACKKDEGTGKMTVKMTDAPGNYTAVNVDIQAIEVHYANGGWTNLPTNAGIYDLLQLRDSVTATLTSGATMATGKVNQMRLILGDSNYVVVDSIYNYPLVIPSGENNGLKLNIDADITVDKDLEILLDFDAGQSIKETGSGKYMLQPVLSIKSIKTN